MCALVCDTTYYARNRYRRRRLDGRQSSLRASFFWLAPTDGRVQQQEAGGGQDLVEPGGIAIGYWQIATGLFGHKEHNNNA